MFEGLINWIKAIIYLSIDSIFLCKKLNNEKVKSDLPNIQVHQNINGDGTTCLDENNTSINVEYTQSASNKN